MENNFSVSSHLWESSTLQHAKLHSHHEYEIYMFLEGNCYYVVEGRKYDLTPGDVIIIRKHEMHRVFHNDESRYHSLVFFVYPEFFHDNHCEEYEQAFLDYGKDNKIDSSTVFSSGFQDAVDRLKKYSNDYTNTDSTIVKSILIEILHIINGIKLFEKPTKTNQSVKNVISYLNDNFTGEVNLDLLADTFFISKFHLCRVFKQATGLTVQEYIRRKRLTLAMELKNEGLTLTEAAAKAGFTDYTSFYRYYKKRYKTTPKETK
jgi:AraC-like DNA-binding protein